MDSIAFDESGPAASAWGYEETRYELHHNLATDHYAWFLSERVAASEWWQASEWFATKAEAEAWNSIDYLRRRDEHISTVLERAKV